MFRYIFCIFFFGAKAGCPCRCCFCRIFFSVQFYSLAITKTTHIYDYECEEARCRWQLRGCAKMNTLTSSFVATPSAQLNETVSSATSSSKAVALKRIVVFIDGRAEAAFEDGSGLIVKHAAVTYFKPNGDK